jgi:hypothetical protein
MENNDKIHTNLNGNYIGPTIIYNIEDNSTTTVYYNNDGSISHKTNIFIYVYRRFYDIDNNSTIITYYKDDGSISRTTNIFITV